MMRILIFTLLLILLPVQFSFATTVTESVEASSDDYLYYGGIYDTYTGNTIRVGYNFNGPKPYWSGFRFQTVAVPQGATVDSAIFSMYIQNDAYDDTVVYAVYAEDTATALTFTDSIDYKARERTTEYELDTLYDPDAGTWTKIFITDVIQELINRGDWSSGNDIALLVEGTDATISDGNAYGNAFCIIQAWDYDGNTTHSAQLIIYYTEGGSSSNRRRLMLRE